MTETIPSDHLMAAGSYFLGPVSGIVIFLLQRNNSFVRFHAMQSTVLFGGVVLLPIILKLIPGIGWMLLMMIGPILYTGSFILWLVLMWKAYHGETFVVPYVGDIARQQIEKLS